MLVTNLQANRETAHALEKSRLQNQGKRLPN